MVVFVKDSVVPVREGGVEVVPLVLVFVVINWVETTNQDSIEFRFSKSSLFVCSTMVIWATKGCREFA